MVLTTPLSFNREHLSKTREVDYSKNHPIDRNPLPETKKGRYSLPFSSSFDCKNSPHPGTAWVRCSKPVTVLKWMKTGASGFS